MRLDRSDLVRLESSGDAISSRERCRFQFGDSVGIIDEFPIWLLRRLRGGDIAGDELVQSLP